MINYVKDIPLYFDEPFADSSVLPTLALSKFTKTKVTVSLSGDGGDELFCGYNKYKNSLRFQKNFLLISKLWNLFRGKFFIKILRRYFDPRFIQLLSLNWIIGLLNLH